MASRTGPDPIDPAAPLRRVLGLTEVTAGGVGIIIGAGIYVLLGAATSHAGPIVWLTFLVAAVLSALTGLSYAELSSMFPSAAGEYEYTRRAMPEWVATGAAADWPRRGAQCDGPGRGMADAGAAMMPLLSSFVVVALAEMGDKTQLATVALGARFASTMQVTAGITLGMLGADGVAVFAGVRFADRVPMRLSRRVAAALFLLFGPAAIAASLGWL